MRLVAREGSVRLAPVLQHVNISPVSPDRFRDVLSDSMREAFDAGVEEARELLAGRAVWNVNSTARGGGVAELLRPLVGYARGVGVDARWAVIEGDPAFFEVTKRIHNRLHGAEGDGGPLDDGARQAYEGALARNTEELAHLLRPGDVVILHDPQTAGMTRAVREAGAKVVWRCHVGLDVPNDLARDAWAFLRPYVVDADAFVFSRRAFAWEGLDDGRIHLIAPSIDAFAPKNQDLDDATTAAVLNAARLVPVGDDEPAIYTRQDGTPGRVDRDATLFQDAPLRADDPVVLQVSRWDALKDPLGVIEGFAGHVPEAHLLYAGPAVAAVSDDPEGERVLREAITARDRLPEEARRRVHLAALPMEDAEENAIIVNALQRHARVVVQKSLAEGFGLTVAEAMWKGRPVVASRIGGIQDQIVDGDSGVLLDDPHDLAAYGAALRSLLEDPDGAERMGERARERVREEFLSARSLLQYLDLLRELG
jgi:trehalose synthase